MCLLEDNTNSAGHAAFEYLGNPFSYAVIHQKILTFHGVLLEYKGRGIVISIQEHGKRHMLGCGEIKNRR